MIYLAGDKHGWEAISYATEYLKERNVPFENLGVQNNAEDIPLEVMIPPLVAKVKEDIQNRGIISCGTGVGVEVGANKFSGIRACLATNPKIAEYSVIYDNCNCLCLVGWDCDKENIHQILDAWFAARYDGSEKRLKMMEVFDTWH